MMHAVLRSVLAAGFCAALGCGAALAADAQTLSPKPGTPVVAFVCSHGTIKSLNAAERFNRLAEQRGLSVRAISRAANEASVDPKVPDPVARDMAKEGYSVADVKPKVLSHEEAASALRVVHISLEGNVDDPDAAAAKDRRVERWDGIPSGLRLYDVMSQMIAERVDAMIEEFAQKQASATIK